MTVRVGVVTGSRADYGLLVPLLRLLAEDPRFALELVVTGAHLADAHGMTLRAIESDGIPVAVTVPLPLEDDARLGVARAMSAAVSGIAEAIEAIAPDVLVLLGDRYEAFAAAAAATVLRVPIAHIHGGELTYGAIDDAFRHSITKMATLHFAAAEEYRRRIVQMGENPDAVFNVGALAADNALRYPALSAEQILQRYGILCTPETLLVTFHPSSARHDSSADLGQLLTALDALAEYRVVFTGSNADPEGATFTARVQEYARLHADRASFVMSLGHEGYLAAVRQVGAVVGNSSSGVIEVPILGTPSVDIGDRQAGRIKPPSVIHVASDAEEIVAGVRKAASPGFRAEAGRFPSPFGDGHTAERIVAVLADTRLLGRVGQKEFFDAGPEECE